MVHLSERFCSSLPIMWSKFDQISSNLKNKVNAFIADEKEVIKAEEAKIKSEKKVRADDGIAPWENLATSEPIHSFEFA